MNQEDTAEVEIPLILGAEENEKGKEEEGGEPIIKQVETKNAAGLMLPFSIVRKHGKST